MRDFILKGDICYCKNSNKIESIKNGFLVCIDGISRGIFKEIPEEYKALHVIDYSEKLIIPGLCDLHTHAPQYSFIGTGMDYELMEWLDKKTFPEEIKYADIAYAIGEYKKFADKLFKSATTRACIFATVHEQATEELMRIFDKTGLFCLVGKVSMDRGTPDMLCENTEDGIESLERIVRKSSDRYKKVKSIVTPRFIPCCSDEFFAGLSVIQQKYQLPVQSHLSENPSEAKLVKELCPESEFYGDAYDKRNFFGKNHKNKTYFKTIMAHCVHSDDREIKLMAENRVFVAHCPSSNMNLASGIAPIRKMLESGVKIGIGTDVAAGNSLSVFCGITDAVQMSKLYYRIIDSNKKPLLFSEAFYMATKGGGEFFGKVGSFEEGYEFDAVILDDKMINTGKDISITDRLERFAYLSGEEYGINAKYVCGEKIL